MSTGGDGLASTKLSCGSCGALLGATAKFCSECGVALTAAIPSAEYKQVTVLFADVVHSMDVATAVGAERLREIMTELVKLTAAVVERYGGTVDKFTGDGIMAIFGAPKALEDHAELACMAALDIQKVVKVLAVDVVRRDGVQLLLRVGLNSGRVIAGEIGSARLGYTAIGQHVGMAQRMESVAPPGGVTVSVSTARLVDGVATLSEPQLVRIKGSTAPVTVYALAAMTAPRGRMDRWNTRYVGRQRELDIAAEALDRAVRGHGAVLRVTGPAGIGKSRFVHETVELARRRNIEVASTICESHARDVPFHVVAELLREATGIVNLGQEAARTRLRLLFADADDDDLLLLFDLLGIQESQVLPSIDADARRRRLTVLINSVWQRRSAVVLYVIEDAHWIDEISESMLADMLSDGMPATSAVLITNRPEYRGALASKPGMQTISLAPLSDSESTTLLDELLGNDHSVRAIRHLVNAQAAGNPFFAQEMVRELAERGVLDGDRGNYRCEDDVSEVSVPATLEATLSARIDRLRPEVKRMLNAAAVIGARLDIDLLSAMVGEVDVTPLIEAELLDPVTLGSRVQYTFRHPLVRAVAYESQLKADRAELHRTLAAALQHQGAGSIEANAALIAEHVEAAADLPGAYSWHMRAGSWLMSRDIAGARLSWDRARGAADALPSEFPDRTALRIYPRTMLCATSWRVGRNADDIGFDELRDLCVAAGDQVSLAAAMSGAMLSQTMANRHRDSSRLASEQIAVFDSMPDPMRIFGVMSAAMFAKIHAGEAAEALRVAHAVIDLLSDDGSMGTLADLGSPLAVALLYRSQARACRGDVGWRSDFDRAIFVQQGELSEQSAVVIVVTYGYTMAITNGLLTPGAAALSGTADVLRNAEKSGDDVALALAQVAHGLLLMYAAPTTRGEGLALISKGRDAQLLQRNLLGVALADIGVAQVKAESGELDDAIAIARATVRDLTESGEMAVRGAASAVLLAALIARGDEGDLHEAQGVIDRLSSVPVERGFALNDLSLLRMRALYARATGDEGSYFGCRDRYRKLASALKFEGHMRWAAAMQ